MTRYSIRRVLPSRAAVGVFAVLTAVSWVAPAPAQVPSVGLSTVRSQRFHNENLLGFYTPQAEDYLGYAVAVGDFNNDGTDDLATAVPGDNGLADFPVEDSGSVVVRFGVPGVGLASNPATTVLRQVPFMNPPEVGDSLGASLTVCDFNGDGFDDLAIGLPGEDHVDRTNAGAVQVHYGSSAFGINFTPEDFFAQSSPGIPGSAEHGDAFGETLTCGDFNADSFDDLVVGTPLETLGSSWGPVPQALFLAGMAVVVPGSAFGLDHDAAFELSQEVDGVDGDPEYPDQFSRGLAAGDFNNDGFDDLAVGSRGEDDWKGALHVFFGGPSGLSISGSLFWMETFIGGSSEDGDDFGIHLVSDDFDADGFEDLAVGIPGDDLGINEAELDAGRIAVLFGHRLGFDRNRTQFWTENEIFGPADSRIDERFGEVMATGDFDKDGFADLAIAHVGEAIGGPQAGQVTILLGSSNGLTDARSREIAAGFAGFPGSAGQAEQLFGYAMAAGDFDADGHADLAIGAPKDDVNGVVDVGSEVVLYGSLFSDGVDTGDTSIWSQTVGSPTGNRIEVNKKARLGPAGGSGSFGMAVVLPDGRSVGTPAFVRVGPEHGFKNERVLKGSFFIDPQDLGINPATGQNFFQFMALQNGVGPAARTVLSFDLLGTATSYALVANFFNEATNSLQLAQPATLTGKGAPDGRNIKIDFEWRAGNPGSLTVWRTFFSTGSPDATGKVQLFSVPLPNTANSVVNAAAFGMVSGQDQGTSGQFYLDEVSFRR